MQMKRETVEQSVVLVSLIAAGSALRLYFSDIPNFAPVAGLALFAGYYFRSTAFALAAPLAMMLVTDQFLGGYQPWLMATVYTMLTLPVLLRSVVRDRGQRWDEQRTGGAWLSFSGTLLLSSVGCSLAFFLATNCMTWLVTPWYPRSAAGLWACLVNAIPFFRFTLAGDLATVATSFGFYFLLRNLLIVRTPIADRASSTV